MKKILCLLSFILLACPVVQAEYKNELRSSFINNKAIIYELNIRTFNAKDENLNGIIDNNEESGNFINAIDRLDELVKYNINTIHVMPITPVGKVKALGTAGSVYAISSFRELNPQLADSNSKLSLKQQAKLFIDEAHKRGISVIIDLPSCGSYDLYMTHPEFFELDGEGNPVVPCDWTDVRVLKTLDNSSNQELYKDIYNEHVAFVNLLLDLKVDGIRADVATMKPYKFWEDLIRYTRSINPEFMFLAEASDSWREPPSPYAPFTAYDKLLQAGFDGYYGSYFNIKDWKKAKDLYTHINFNKKIQKKGKSVIGSFTTHDEISPILLNGTNFSKMIMWLNATLPLNPYYVDGFATGDTYVYPLGNKKASLTQTDDDFYFVHRGKIDIFNFSRKPDGGDTNLEEEFIKSTTLRKNFSEVVEKGKLKILKTNNPSIFAYSITYNRKTVVVTGNLDFRHNNSAKIKITQIKKDKALTSVRRTTFKQNGSTLNLEYKPGETHVFTIIDYLN